MSIKGVILVGGPSKGTRFRPLSLHIAKPLFPIAGEPMISHHIQALSQVPGLTHIYILGLYEADVFESYLAKVKEDFEKKSMHITVEYFKEAEEGSASELGLGTGGGLYCYQEKLKANNTKLFFVLHADVCSLFPLAAMLESHKRQEQAGSPILCTILGTRNAVPREIAHHFGCLVTASTASSASSQPVLHFVEKPEGFLSDLINCGLYLFSTDIFQLGLNHRRVDDNRIELNPRTRSGSLGTSLQPFATTPSPLSEGSKSSAGMDSKDSTELHNERGRGMRLRLEQDVIAPLAERNALYVYESTGFWCQIKTAGSPIVANHLYLDCYASQGLPNYYPKQCPRAQNGPEILGPVYIHPTAVLHPTAKIGPYVSIGPDCHIGQGARLHHAILVSSITVSDFAYVHQSILGTGCTLGKWARVEGSPESPFQPLLAKAGSHAGHAAREGVSILAGDIHVKAESQIRHCVVLPHKELKDCYHHEIIM